MKKIILASSSPRRKDLLCMTEIPFEIRVKHTAEIHPRGVPEREIPVFLAKQKAHALADEIEEEIVIGADTIVLLDNKILEKPSSPEHACEMLKLLSGRTHEVITGVCLYSKEKEVVFSETTKVTFYPLTDEQINYYVSHYRPFDKAGSYACQEWIGAIGISRFEGDYFNVVGLPVSKVYRALVEEFGLRFI
ncbi:MAG: Maf family nucleotide pyrophosphatase [Chitinophagales bacterium]|nr:Maf family nucleotide pyrophosphatase [Chitinophagales bacterium]MDW8273158.1 Maf family nucleotide pyrophosphatase [Chitinophagales bacterium]